MEEKILYEGLTWEIYTVSQLTSAIKDALEGEFVDLWVEGEISNLRSPASGHTYLTLKDDKAQLRGVIWKSTTQILKFKPEDGLQVLARGRITVYEPRGEYQLIIEYMEPKGVGALQFAFEQLKKRLFEEGLFNEEHKKPLPLLPQRIGVVTSPSGAAFRDILRVIGRRFANVHIILYPVRVQGEGAAEEIADAIRALNSLPSLCPGMPNIDVIIVGRGGGSLEDLWAFNEEKVARAIYESSIPIISAVGHEIDFTISDMVADVRAPTPSAAAVMVVMSKEEISRRLADLRMRLVNALHSTLNLCTERLEGIYRRRPFTMPAERISRLQQRVDELSMRLCREEVTRLTAKENQLNGLHQHLHLLSPGALISRYRDHLMNSEKVLLSSMRNLVENKYHKFREFAGKLNSLSPLSVLERGYTICYRLPAMEVVKDASSLQIGDKLRLRFSRGSAVCRMEQHASEGNYDGRNEV